jgi:hypothetical protein
VLSMIQKKSKYPSGTLCLLILLAVGVIVVASFLRKGEHSRGVAAVSAEPPTKVVQPTEIPPASGNSTLPESQPTAVEFINSGSEQSHTINTQVVVQVKPAPKKKVVQDPLAREALSLVGIDPEAELYWFSALGDPTLPKSERQDLVDDLNEQGLADPKHPTIEDVPLILARINILAEAMRTFGEDAYDWKEPYDDLANLVELALGGGKPVQ